MAKAKPDGKKQGQVKSQTKLFFSGVLILTAANLVIKLAGLLFKVPMNYIVGDTGMGYYGSAYSIYTFLYMLSTAGLPVAVSIMVAEGRSTGRFSQVKKVFRLSLLLFCLIGAAGSGLMFFFADRFAEMIGSPPTKDSILVIAPTLFFICISSAYRGYFQGYQQMLPTAVSQLLEALCKLVLGVAAALYAIRMGCAIHETAAYAVSGLTVGAFLGMAFLMAAKFAFRPAVYDADYREFGGESLSTAAILKRFAVISLPITVSASVMSLTNMIDTVLIQRLLQLSGMAQEEATTLYGNYTSLAVPMFNLPPVLIYPITYSIVPLLTSARAAVDQNRTKKIVESSLRVAVLLGLPCAFGLSALAEPILRLFYKTSSAHVAAPLLALLAPSSFFVCLLAITNAILQACGRAGKPVLSMVVGAGIKILSSVPLIRWFGMAGAPISTFLCYFAATLMNFAYVIRYTGLRPNFVRMFWKPLCGGAVCALAAYGSLRIFSRVIPEHMGTLLAIAVGAGAYLAVILALRAVTKEDWEFFPGRERLAKLWQRLLRRRKEKNGPLATK